GPRLPPGGAALLQGKRAGEVALVLPARRHAPPPGWRLAGPDPRGIGRRRALRAVDRRAGADLRLMGARSEPCARFRAAGALRHLGASLYRLLSPRHLDI